MQYGQLKNWLYYVEYGFTCYVHLQIQKNYNYDNPNNPLNWVFNLLCILDEKVDEMWIHVNHSCKSNDRWQTIFFTITIWTIEHTCQFLVVNATIYHD